METGGLSGLLFQCLVELVAIAGELCLVLRRAKLRDETGGVPRGSAGQLVALKNDDVGDASLGEVVRNRCADDSAADNDDRCVVGKLGDHQWRSSSFSGSHTGPSSTVAPRSSPKMSTLNWVPGAAASSVTNAKERLLSTVKP